MLPLREEGDIMGRLGDNYSKGDQWSGKCCLSGKRETLWRERLGDDVSKGDQW